MKVVAHISNQVVLVEAHIDELAKVQGFSSAWHMSRETLSRNEYAAESFPIGKQIEVAKLWRIIEHERARPDAIAQQARNLRALADMLEGVNQALPTPDADVDKAPA